MSFREIVVCLEREEDVTSLSVLANRLGAGLHAYVTGVHAEPSFEVRGEILPYVPESVINKLQHNATEVAENIKFAFENTMAQGDTNWNWVKAKSRTHEEFLPYLNHALAADLVVTAQPQITVGEATLQRQLLLKTSTPVIMAPPDYGRSVFAERIAVAWNNTAEASRAIREAMPLLASAGEVHVISVMPLKDKKSGVDDGQRVICDYLDHHNVPVSYHTLTGGRHDVSHCLLDHVDANDIDLLVMGAFGHSRLYDAVIGAATGEMMRTTQVPLFLSH